MEAIVDGDREELDYGTFGVATRQLCQQVVDSGFEPDWIVAIARGGLLIGGAVAYALRCKNIGVVNVEFYTDIDERLEVPVMLPPALNLADLADTKLLIVDDVADTGETLKLVVDTCAPVVAEIRSLGVDVDQHGNGQGRALVQYMLQRAKDLELKRVIVLTRVPLFFERLGFSYTSKDRLPEKVMKDCDICPKRHACDEVAMEVQLG